MSLLTSKTKVKTEKGLKQSVSRDLKKVGKKIDASEAKYQIFNPVLKTQRGKYAEPFVVVVPSDGTPPEFQISVGKKRFVGQLTEIT